MTKVLVATANPDKAKEIAALLPGLDLQYLTLRDFPGYSMPPETGATLLENAVLKAETAARALKIWTLADDTGLEVDYLNGAPGVLSARYAGFERDYAKNNEKLLRDLAGVPEGKRTARFRCVAALSSPEGKVTMEEGILDGAIGFSPRGTQGFGYDPLFIPAGRAQTLAELSFPEKNSISHRYKAIMKMAQHLRRLG